MIIAVDFDNTIARTTFPEIHGEIAGAIDALKRFQQAGHIIILWTCREGEMLKDALFWLADHGFTPDCANCHSEKQIAEWGTDPRKIGADVYIDDRNALCEMGRHRMPFLAKKRRSANYSMRTDCLSKCCGNAANSAATGQTARTAALIMF